MLIEKNEANKVIINNAFIDFFLDFIKLDSITFDAPSTNCLLAVMYS